MREYDIANWVAEEKVNRYIPFRQAIHTIIYAIAHNRTLNTEMIMKGGILLAIQYGSTRFTTDLDFSTHKKINQINIKQFLQQLDKSLVLASETLNYGLDCRLQSYKQKPPSSESSFPTLIIKIGYAYKADKKNHRRLLNKKSLHVVEVDFSFNEFNDKIESIGLSEGGGISVYSFNDLIAEKFRAILQQKVRNRYRRQDVYDLYYLLNKFPVERKQDKKTILNSLLEKSKSRNLNLKKNSMDQKEIIKRTQKDYNQLAREIEGRLPPFEKVYNQAQKFYKSLPWKT